MSTALSVWAATDLGCVRQRNEDALCVGGTTVSGTARWSGQFELDGEVPRIVAVVDGMGGHRGGCVASDLVARALADPPACVEPTKALVHSWMNRINALVHGYAAGRPDLCGMGATVAALWFGHRTGLCVNVGDARVYRQQDGYLDLRSDDHAIVLPDGSQRLFMSVGGDAELQPIQPTIASEPLADRRRYLLCTDGLPGEVGLETLERLMLLPPAQAAAAMVAAARDAGGRDNITLAIVEVRSGGVA